MYQVPAPPTLQRPRTRDTLDTIISHTASTPKWPPFLTPWPPPQLSFMPPVLNESKQPTPPLPTSMPHTSLLQQPRSSLQRCGRRVAHSRAGR